MLAFLIIGFMIMGSTHPAYDSIDYKDAAGNDRFVNTVSEFYQEDAQLCCATAGVSQESGLCTELTVESGRRALTARLLAADGEDFKSQSNFDYKKGDMFEAFSAHPEIPATLISTVLVIAVGWILLLRTFSREIVFTTELVKVSERSERASRKTKIRATTILTLSHSITFVRLARLPSAPLKMRLASLGAGCLHHLHGGEGSGRKHQNCVLFDGVGLLWADCLEKGERAKRKSLDEDEHTRDESRKMATDIMEHPLLTTLFHPIRLARLVRFARPH